MFLQTTWVIDRPGYYKLDESMIFHPALNCGILVQSNNVVLDLNGYEVMLNTSKSKTSHAIEIKGSDVSIVNGKIVGAWIGICANRSNYLKIENVTFRHIKYIGINISDSEKAVITHNVFRDFDFTLDKVPPDFYLIGMNLGISYSVINHNKIIQKIPENFKTVEYVAILFGQDSRRNLTEYNYIANNQTLAKDGTSLRKYSSYGIWQARDVTKNIVRNNYIKNIMYPMVSRNSCEPFNNVIIYGKSSFEKRPIPIKHSNIVMQELLPINYVISEDHGAKNYKCIPQSFLPFYKTMHCLQQKAALYNQNKLNDLIVTDRLLEARELLNIGGVNLDALIYSGLSPLMLSALLGKTEMIRLFFEHGVNPDFKNEEGMTALHYAVYSGNLLCFELIYHTVKVKRPKTAEGHTPSDFAKIQNKRVILEYIQKMDHVEATQRIQMEKIRSLAIEF